MGTLPTNPNGSWIWMGSMQYTTIYTYASRGIDCTARHIGWILAWCPEAHCLGQGWLSLLYPKGCSDGERCYFRHTYLKWLDQRDDSKRKAATEETNQCQSKVVLGRFRAAIRSRIILTGVTNEDHVLASCLSSGKNNHEMTSLQYDITVTRSGVDFTPILDTSRQTYTNR